MLCYTGVLVLLALLSQGANGHKDNVREMTEQTLKYLKRIILHQEQQQRVQDERMERLEQMVNETVEGQRRLQQQQVEHQVNILAMSQKLRENEERSAELIRGQRVQDERMERLEQMLNESVEGQSHLGMQVDQLQQQQVEHQVTILAMSQKLTENEERSAELIRGQHVQDERMERLEQMLNESVEGQRHLQQQQVEHQVTIVGVSQKLTENEESCAELVRDQVGSMMQLGNVSLEQLRDDVARQISAQQLHLQARDDVLLGKMMELADSTTQSERSLVANYEEIQSSVSENIRQILGALTGVKQGQSQIMEVVAGDSKEIQVGLTRVQDEVRTCNERQLLGRNMTVMLAEIKGTCESVASSVSTAEELLTSGFRGQRRLVSANAGLLGAVNQTCATAAEQSLQLLNNALSDISDIHDIQYGVRLVGCGSTPCREGRLEVWAYGSWGTVCDDEFGMWDARVACYSLGFGRVGRPIGNRYGAAASGPILLDDLMCNGSESSLFRCQHGGVGRHDCRHHEDISISCY